MACDYNKYFPDDGFPPEEREEIYRQAALREKRKQKIIRNIALIIQCVLSITALTIATIVIMQVLIQLSQR